MGTHFGFDDGAETLFRHGQEGVTVCGGPHGIDRDIDGAVCAVLEPNSARQSGSEFSMDLGLRSSSADSTPRRQLSGELR